MKTQDKQTHHLDIEGIGHFEFSHRNLRADMRIVAEYSRLTEGVETPTPWLDLLSTMIATLKVLSVVVPDDWDIDNADPLDPKTYQRIVLVYNTLREQEARFRGNDGSIGQETGKGDGRVAESVVQENVSTSA